MPVVSRGDALSSMAFDNRESRTVVAETMVVPVKADAVENPVEDKVEAPVEAETWAVPIVAAEALADKFPVMTNDGVERRVIPGCIPVLPTSSPMVESASVKAGFVPSNLLDDVSNIYIISFASLHFTVTHLLSMYCKETYNCILVL